MFRENHPLDPESYSSIKKSLAKSQRSVQFGGGPFREKPAHIEVSLAVREKLYQGLRAQCENLGEDWGEVAPIDEMLFRGIPLIDCRGIPDDVAIFCYRGAPSLKPVV